MKKPKVSVVMITYAHENFIEQAINGVLMQECDFEVELIIGNDCSPDKTDEVVKEIIKNHPRTSRIKYIKHEKNIGAMSNFIFALNMAKGKYTALCEGDDYWTDPFKLQKQVDFLEANPKYSFSMGKVKILKQQSGKIIDKEERVNPSEKETYILKDYLKGLFSQTSTFVFRNNLESFPNWLLNAHAGDQSIVVIMTGSEGKIKYHNEYFSIYRWHEKSVSRTVNYNVYEKFLETLDFWNLHLNKKYDFLFKIVKLKYRIEINLEKAKSRYSKKIYKISGATIQYLLERI